MSTTQPANSRPPRLPVLPVLPVVPVVPAVAGVGVEHLDASGVLSFVGDVQRLERFAQASLLAGVAQWADLHAVLGPQHRRQPALVGPGVPDVPGGERLLAPGGDGTPGFGEFAVAELAARLGMGVEATTSLMVDALDLRHRLPRLWGYAVEGVIEVWRARTIAQQTHPLSMTAALVVDERICGTPDCPGPVLHLVGKRLTDKVAAEMLHADPHWALQQQRLETDDQGVFLSPDSVHGIGSMFIKAPAPDLAALDHTLNQIATILRANAATDGTGDPGNESDESDESDGSRQRLRARAIGILADPETAAALIRAAQTAQTAETGEGAGGRSARRGPRVGRAVVYLHVTPDAISGDGSDVGRSEQFGPVLARTVQDWCGHRDVVVKPVIDLNHQVAVDAYEIPDRLRERVILRTPADTFPYATNRTRTGDIDHSEAFQVDDQGNAPPGQTRDDNLARKLRRTHRLKTHGTWRYRQLHNGCFLWITPHDHAYLVDHTGTHPLGILTEA